jgi:hypothetical protein
MIEVDSEIDIKRPYNGFKKVKSPLAIQLSV